MPRRRFIVALADFPLLLTAPGNAQDRSITVASTTSTEQSGLFGRLLPAFTAKTGIRVRVVAAGTGQALDVGRRGDADVVCVHDRQAEDAFVAEGGGDKGSPPQAAGYFRREPIGGSHVASGTPGLAS